MISLAERVRRLKKPRILLAGDLILDHYVRGEVKRISPEAPIPILEVKGEQFKLGGVGNVAANVVSMGGEAHLFSVVGADKNAEHLRELLAAQGIADNGLVVDSDRPTTIKTRHVASVHQMIRVDWESRNAISGKALRDARRRLTSLISSADLVIVSDYGKGALPAVLLEELIRQAKKRKCPVLVDPKGKDYSSYRGASLVTPNRSEAEQATGISIEEDLDLARVAKKLIRDLDLEAALITLGADGVYYHTKEDESQHIPTEAAHVFDVTGAGDTVIAQLALFLAGGASLEESVRLANLAAGIVVGKFGTASVTREELLARLDAQLGGVGKIVESSKLDTLVSALRRDAKRIVFTNGCFDILHAGHVEYLQKARSYGDVLIVGVNDDASVRRLKGAGRPIQSIEDRLQILAGLQAVNHVVAFSQDTPVELIQKITPHVLVKGEDWKDKGVAGREWVEGHGGLVVLAKMLSGRSTSTLVKRIQEMEGRKKKYAKTN